MNKTQEGLLWIGGSMTLVWIICDILLPVHLIIAATFTGFAMGAIIGVEIYKGNIK